MRASLLAVRCASALHAAPLLFASLSALLTAGCGSFVEPPARADATPPAGYAPIFVQKIAPLPPQRPSTLTLAPGRADFNGRMIRVYTHLIDSTGTYYYGATTGASKKQWCLVTDSVNGKVQAIKDYTLREITEKDREPIAVALVMDHSGSMGEERARVVQDAAEQFIRSKNAEDGVALMRYDDNVVVDAGITTNTDALLSRLQKVGLQGMGGGTAILSGASAAIEHLDTAAKGFKRKAVVVFTDGHENSSSIKKDSLIRLAWKKGIPVCAVDFGAGIKDGYMEEIARGTGGSYAHIYRTQEFPLLFGDVYRRLKNYYVIEFPQIEYGVHTVRVRFCDKKDSLESVITFDNTPDVGIVSLLSVKFDHDKTSLQPGSQEAIDNVVRMLRAYPSMRIELRGHTDNRNRTGDKDYNLTLSRNRANVVREAILKAGIAPDRVTALGLGDTEPVALNDTDEGRALNRRTEFKVIAR